jgi:hypothetical protein
MVGYVSPGRVSTTSASEAGSIYSPSSRRRVLLVVEIKTVIADVQGLLGGVDVKVRLASRIVAERGWRPAAVTPAIIVSDTQTNRRRVAEHHTLFGRQSHG